MQPLYAALRLVPLPLYDPFRRGAVSLQRGSLRRNICIAVLKLASRAQHHRLAGLMPEIRPLDMPGLAFRSVDSMVMDAVYWFGVGGYEGKVAELWVALCRKAGAVLEIGGNVGLFTVIGARVATGPYTVLEPVPTVAAVLRDNLARNGLGRVRMLEAAAIPGTEQALGCP